MARSGVFQSTRPVKGATGLADDVADLYIVSIHAPREGRDPYMRTQAARGGRFQSTRPVKGATGCTVQQQAAGLGFNPRAP